MGICATLTAIRCPICGAIIMLMMCDKPDGLLVGECGNCGTKVEKRRDEPEPRVSKPS